MTDLRMSRHRLSPLRPAIEAVENEIREPAALNAGVGALPWTQHASLTTTAAVQRVDAATAGLLRRRAPDLGEHMPDTALASCAVREAYQEHVDALIADYRRAVDTIMTSRYGPDWATRGDLPDDVYTAETDFYRWLNDLRDHIDAAARPLPEAPS